MPDVLMSAAEIQALFTETLPPPELDVVAQQVTDAVREHCGWRVAPALLETFTLTARRNKLFIPSLFVNSVTSVTDNGVILVPGTDYAWESFGLIERLTGSWSTSRRAVVVQVNHGFATCPGTVAEVIKAAVSRAMLGPEGGVISETTMSASARFSQVNGAAVGGLLLQHELAALDQFRVRQSR